MYFNSPKDFTGFRDKPSGVVLLEECSVRELAEESNLGACVENIRGGPHGQRRRSPQRWPAACPHADSEAGGTFAL
jgi:hypothetical protein